MQQSRITAKDGGVLLIGESLGGLLAVRAAERSCKGSVKGIVTISAPFDTPEHVSSRLIAEGARLSEPDPIKYVRSQINGKDDLLSERRQAVHSADLFRAFFTKASWQEDAAGRVGRLVIPIPIIMGSLESDMGIQRLKQLKPLQIFAV